MLIDADHVAVELVQEEALSEEDKENNEEIENDGDDQNEDGDGDNGRVDAEIIIDNEGGAGEDEDDWVIDQLLSSAHDEDERTINESIIRRVQSSRFVVPPVPLSRSFFQVPKINKAAKVIFENEQRI